MNTFKIRPFKIPILLNSVEAMVITGSIKEKDFIINCFDKNHHLSVVEISNDKKGAYSIINEIKIKTDGFIFSIEPDFEKEGGSVQKGCCIKFHIPDKYFKKSNIYNIVIPPIFSVAVFFNFDGNYNGYSSLKQSGSDESPQA